MFGFESTLYLFLVRVKVGPHSLGKKGFEHREGVAAVEMLGLAINYDLTTLIVLEHQKLSCDWILHVPSHILYTHCTLHICILICTFRV